MVLVQQVALDTIFCLVIPVYGLGYLDIQKQVFPHLLWFFEYLYNCTQQKHFFHVLFIQVKMICHVPLSFKTLGCQYGTGK